MRLTDGNLRWLSAIIITASFSSPSPSFATANLAEQMADLDAALLTDIIESYTTYDPSTCNSPSNIASTSFSYNFPGSSSNTSGWFASFVDYEQSLFQASMSHNDPTGNLSWTIKIGTGGNMYSHYVPNLYGETMPPQAHPEAPWIDEVSQSVSVNGLNGQNGYPYFIHQAGAYQRDPTYLNSNMDPFYSPSLAKHCEGNSCTFASWGTQAHVPTIYTSPVLYINRYTNCGGGVIEHNQMLHNFAPPSATASQVDQTYFNVPWMGVRSSSLPYAFEPNPSTGSISYNDVNNVGYAPLCAWGDNAPLDTTAKDTRGYTIFADKELLVNDTIPEVTLPCRNNAISCSGASASTCMVDSCTDAEISAGTRTRINLRVAANSNPGCTDHSRYTIGDQSYVVMGCKMRGVGFGQHLSYVTGAPCVPWLDIVFINTRTGASIKVPWVRHWSWSASNERLYFGVYETDFNAARNLVHSTFNNVGFGSALPIEVRFTGEPLPAVPPTYDPNALDSFTIVYGNGVDYTANGNNVGGKGRRRLGHSHRDFTAVTVNWWSSGARLEPGQTYINRGFYFNSNLGSATTIGDDLVSKTYIEHFDDTQYSPRTIDIYRHDVDTHRVVVMTSDAPQGTVTECGNDMASVICSGSSTPSPNKVAYFYVVCGMSTYLGPSPYHFTPNHADTFPYHSSSTNYVRSYLCAGESTSIRPVWKLMGWFDPTDPGCASLSSDTSGTTYDEAVCFPEPSISPSASAMPTSIPSVSPSTAPSSSGEPSSSPSDLPSDVPSSSVSPSEMPTHESTYVPSSSTSPSFSPSLAPSFSPSKTLVNLATVSIASASQSSTCYGGGAWRAHDGSMAQLWRDGSVMHTCNTSNPWWMVDLGTTQIIGHVRILNRSDCCGSRLDNSVVQILDENSVIVDSLPITNILLDQVINFPRHTMGRYVRVQKTASGILNIAEVMVMGESTVPTASPTLDPTDSPSTSNAPSNAPSSSPTVGPTNDPSTSPTDSPSVPPTMNPSVSPSHNPTSNPSKSPTDSPSKAPTQNPSEQPTSSPINPTGSPTSSPSKAPSSSPSPTLTPTDSPSKTPSKAPSSPPTSTPTISSHPSILPSDHPSVSDWPTSIPSTQPSKGPTGAPINPTSQPSSPPSHAPSSNPSSQPTGVPTTAEPTSEPTSNPSSQPSNIPTSQPSSPPTLSPSQHPTSSPENPTNVPSSSPSQQPTSSPENPTNSPSSSPSNQPTSSPENPTNSPTSEPTSNPTSHPSSPPSHAPSSNPTSQPTSSPSKAPTSQPSSEPSQEPSSNPTSQPTSNPSQGPTSEPTSNPSSQPSNTPTAALGEDSPTSGPTKSPTNAPTNQPTSNPSIEPSSQPTAPPTLAPTNNPTAEPMTANPTNSSPLPICTIAKEAIDFEDPLFVVDVAGQRITNNGSERAPRRPWKIRTSDLVLSNSACGGSAGAMFAGQQDDGRLKGVDDWSTYTITVPEGVGSMTFKWSADYRLESADDFHVSVNEVVIRQYETAATSSTGILYCQDSGCIEVTPGDKVEFYCASRGGNEWCAIDDVIFYSN